MIVRKSLSVKGEVLLVDVLMVGEPTAEVELVDVLTEGSMGEHPTGEEPMEAVPMEEVTAPLRWMHASSK